MADWLIEHGDCVEVLKNAADGAFDAIVTDPPYGLEFMGKEWDKLQLSDNKSGPQSAGWHDNGGKNPYARRATPRYAGKLLGPKTEEMQAQQAWHEAWAAECLRVLKPGGHLLAFGGTRTYHRMACAIEDAGFEVRDSIHWVRGAGFPKSLNLKGEWSGWGTALKPAHEPIVVARKPLIGTVAENVQQHGTGALNIDGCRVGIADWGSRPPRTPNAIFGNGKGTNLTASQSIAGMGRWPSNLLLSHTPECGETCAEDCAVAEMDRQSGGASRFFPVFKYQAKASRKDRGFYLTCDCEADKAPAWVKEVRSQLEKMGVISPQMATCEETMGGDYDCSTSSSGSAHTDPSLPVGKSITKTETSSTIDSKTSNLSRQLNTSDFMEDAKSEEAFGSSLAESVANTSPSTRPISTFRGKAGRCTGVAVPATYESLWKKKSCGDCGKEIKAEGHPTVKPVALMEWLIKLVTPPGGVVLDPFAGSGTTGVAAKKLGFNFIGIEREEAYVEIARKRIEAAQD